MLISLVLLMIIISSSFAAGIKVDTGILTLPDGRTIKVGFGFYLTQEEGIDVATGIEILKADLARVEKERCL